MKTDSTPEKKFLMHFFTTATATTPTTRAAATTSSRNQQLVKPFNFCSQSEVPDWTEEFLRRKAVHWVHSKLGI